MYKDYIKISNIAIWELCYILFVMRLHRFYIEQKVPYSEKTGRGEVGEITLADSELIHQMVNVFRFKTGDKVILFDGSGFEFECEIILINKKEVGLKIISHSAKAPRDKNISLFLALIKKGNFELAAEKCTEVGVSEIHPIISERSEKKDLNIERLNKIVKEASEQSGRVTLPKVFEITDLEKAVTQVVSEGKVCVTFHPTSLGSYDGASTSNNIALFVGPEGGWTDSEIELFKKNNFKILSLGTNILRAETAAIVAVWSQLNNN